MSTAVISIRFRFAGLTWTVQVTRCGRCWLRFGIPKRVLLYLLHGKTRAYSRFQEPMPVPLNSTGFDAFVASWNRWRVLHGNIALACSSQTASLIARSQDRAKFHVATSAAKGNASENSSDFPVAPAHLQACVNIATRLTNCKNLTIAMSFGFFRIISWDLTFLASCLPKRVPDGRSSHVIPRTD